MVWYTKNEKELFEELGSSSKGLSSHEAGQRLKRYGLNQLKTKNTPLWKIIIEPFKSVFILILCIAALISLINGEILDVVIIGVTIMISAVIYYSQEYATTKILRSLKSHNIQTAEVLRDGKRQTISSVYLVPGDVIVLSEGERVPADARIIDNENLQINEASLTGESVPVFKHASTLEEEKEIYEQDNMVFQGTFALAGSASAIIVDTGANTEFGKIAGLATDKKSKSPVQAKIDKVVVMIVKVATILAILVLCLEIYRGISFAEALRFVLSMTVSAVPEGLPVALTVIIVLGMRRMAKKKALVRSFSTIEDIGLITTIATDKTGTLTKNHLSVVDYWPFEGKDLKSVAAMATDMIAGQPDPLDQALKEAIGKLGSQKADKVYAFDIALRMSGAFLRKDMSIYIKGSPEHILEKSNLSKVQRTAAESSMHEMTSKGYRVIAFGVYNIQSDEPPVDLSDVSKGSLEFYGFVAFADELRPEAKSAITAARQAGINVKLITGDHIETAFNIGKKLGLVTNIGQVVQGSDLPKNIAALTTVVKDKIIFARILPEDKYRILKALKRTEITAMTGDGVNDVPALANAHIGIAMGSGSDIAKDAGGMILMNDNFLTIIKAISEGRKIFDNIRKMLFYLFSTSLGEILTFVGALVLGIPLPVTAIQILWVNLVTDTAMVLPLGLEPEEKNIMSRPPRRPKDKILSNAIIVRIALIAITMATVTLTISIILLNRGESIKEVRTVAFMIIVVAQWTNALNARSEIQSLFSRIKVRNYSLMIGLVVGISLQMLAMFGPLSNAFKTYNLPMSEFVWTSAIMIFAIIFVSEVHKLIIRILAKRRLQVSQAIV